MSRTVPTTGTDRQRLATLAADLFVLNELSTTRDQNRLFMGGSHLLSGSVWHGELASEAAMLALNTSSTRGCFPLDLCYRTDEDKAYICVSNRGALLADWHLLADNNSSGGGSSFDIREVWLKS